jgi:hypothetical protein
MVDACAFLGYRRTHLSIGPALGSGALLRSAISGYFIGIKTLFDRPCSRVVSRRHIAPRAPPLPSPPSRCPTSGPPGSATAPPTLSPAAWSSAARACPTPRSTASSTEPVRPRSRVPLFSIRVSCVITPTARPRPRGGGAREPPRSSGIDRSTLVGRRDGDARLARALETARPLDVDRSNATTARRWQRGPV